MSKEQIIDIRFSKTPDVRVRVIEDDDPKSVIKQKKKYPFELYNAIAITVVTTFREFTFRIPNGYIWNGADIPRILWRIIGSRTDNDYLIASMVHDFMLQFKNYMFKEIFLCQLTMYEYRRLTSLVFRYIIKKQGTNSVKASIMSWCVDYFQHYLNRKEWKNCEFNS